MSFSEDDETLLDHDDTPFLKEDIKPKFELIAITHELEEELLAVDIQNDVTALLGNRGTVIVRDSESSSSPVRTVVRQPYKIFLHPQGLHCLVSTLDGNLHYYSTKHKKATTHFLLQHKSGTEGGANATASNVAESVYWTNTVDTKNTGTILVGTKTGGQIFEVRIEYSGPNETNVAVCRQIAQLVNCASSPICGIETEKVNGQTIVFITTPTRFCRVSGTGEPRKIIQENAKSMTYQELPSSSDNPAKGCMAIFRSKLGVPGQSYAWSSSMGIVHGFFNHQRNDDDDEENADDEEPVQNHSILTLHRKQSAQGSSNRFGLPEKTPSEVLLTAFHMLLLYEDRFIVLNHPAGLTWKPINGSELQDFEIADRIRFDPFRYRKVRRLLGMIRDVSQRKVYLYNSASIWELMIEQEPYTQWRLFLERAIDTTEDVSLRKRYYRAAFNLTKKDAQRRDLVQYSRGMFYLGMKSPEIATTILAQCNRFEDIYVQLAQQKSQAILRKFLEKRYKLLTKYRWSSQSMQSQIACLTMHLVQLKLDNMCKCEGDARLMESASNELDVFLKSAARSNASVFDDKAFYQMVAKAVTCQGRIPNMLTFAQLLHRVHFTISYFLSQQEFTKACDVLIKYGTKDDRFAEAWYDFAPVIIVNCPVKLITGLLRAVVKHPDGTQEHLLDIERLIPAFIRYYPKLNEVPNNTEHQVIVFVERCIEKLGCVSNVIHNYYVSLLAQFDHERLADFFSSEEPQFFTTEYALRRCLELHRFQQCIPLYKKLGLYEDAICIAMECSRPEANGRWHGLQTAKAVLQDPSIDLDSVSRKKLWMMVAERVIDQIGTRQALAIVEESSGVLKLEDVLSKINDNTVIQNFKEAVCKSLDEYTGAITELNSQQRDAFQMSESIKREIHDLKHRYGFVTSKQRCQLCHKGLLQGASPFLVYPSCRHVFHEACVVRRLEELGGLPKLRATEGLPHGYLDDVHSLEDLAQMECVFCGECTVLEITKDFFVDGEDLSWSTD